jgi:hypothetical protein
MMINEKTLASEGGGEVLRSYLAMALSWGLVLVAAMDSGCGWFLLMAAVAAGGRWRFECCKAATGKARLICVGWASVVERPGATEPWSCRDGPNKRSQ